MGAPAACSPHVVATGDRQPQLSDADRKLIAADWQPPVGLEVLGDLPAFPTRSLPGWMSDYVEALAVATQTPVDVAATMALSAVAGACARKFEVEVKPDWREPLNLYLMEISESGTRKTAVVRAVGAPIAAHEIEANEALSSEIADKAQRLKIARERLERAEKDAAQAKDEDYDAKIDLAQRRRRELEEIVVPQTLREMADDATPERVVTLLKANHERLLILAAEGDVIDIAAGRYQSGNLNIGVYLRGHTGEVHMVDRVGRPSEILYRPALSIGLSVQPDVLRSLQKNPSLRGRGFVARFLFAVPHDLLGSRLSDPPAVPEAVRNRFHAQLRLLYEIPAPTDHREIPTLSLNRDAFQALLRFSDTLEPGLARGGELRGIKDWAGKLAGAVVRIAGNLHVAAYARRNTDAPPGAEVRTIEQWAIEEAITIGRFYLAHAKAAFAMMGEEPAVENARVVLDYLAGAATEVDHGIVYRRAVQRRLKNTVKKAAELDEALDVLLEHGWVRELEPEGDGNKKRRRFIVHPEAQFLLSQSSRLSEACGGGG